ncbi:alpha/beta hydrolase [Seonamhaeicola maritimus]|uniref:alpha/beta hydrolase n=1 Tax=Seonamhaeicola maritimus TaxID=2591822 RepID=UPI0024958E52|nr:alpha/beta hydrolase [Seonamhaeicola maritimus]
MKQKQFTFFVIIALLFSVNYSFSQSDDVYYWNNTELVSSSDCLSNKSNFDDLKLAKTSTETITNFKIYVEVNFKNKVFDDLKSFNDFDLEFWLLSHRAFKAGASLKITIAYTINSEEKEQFYNFCLKHIESIVRGEKETSKKTEYVKHSVYFATDRNKVKTKNLNDAFGNKRADLQYGICEVSIPLNHDLGKIESPSIWKFEFSEDPSKHIMIRDIDMLEKDKFFKSLSRNIKKSKTKSTFLFVHGYNTSFSEAAKRTAQISHDLLFEGKPVFYSWPSQASMFKYPKDEANIEWARYNIKNFLEDYISKSEAEDIYLVAHSMGNRGLTKAIVELMTEKPHLRKNIKEIILAAPDIDADVFRNDIAPKMASKIQKPITLYVSSDDLALKASKALHGNPRAGDSGSGLVIVKGVETIDASGVDTSFLSHSYFADTNSIISDIFDIIKSGKRALNRERLKLMKFSDDIYWRVKQ